MNFLKSLIAVAALLALCQPLQARGRLPVIDMHLHTMVASAKGPPRGRCTPVPGYPAWDPAQPLGKVILKRLEQPPCADPVWSRRATKS